MACPLCCGSGGICGCTTCLPLLDAAEADGEVLACYVLDPRLKASSGPRRLQYLYDALRELRDALDGRLLVTRGRPETRIPALAKAIGATSVHVSADFTPVRPATRRRRARRAGRRAAGGVGVAVSGVAGPGHQGRRHTVQGVHAVLRRLAQARLAGAGQVGPDSARWIDPAEPSRAASRSPTPASQLELPAGEKAALRQWKSVRRATGSRATPTTATGPISTATSRMSAHLKFGTIHPRTMAADLGSGKGAQAYLRELAFRDFYAAVLYEWPDSAWWNWNKAFDRSRSTRTPSRRRRSRRGRPDAPGFPIVDAGMRQLAETGFMHNRVRMIVASFLVKDLHLPWQWGARWFLEQLVDGDMASNQHGWQWAAGCGTDAAPYFRVFNPTTQGEKFDPDGDTCGAGCPSWATTTIPTDRRPQGRAGRGATPLQPASLDCHFLHRRRHGCSSPPTPVGSSASSRRRRELTA